MQSRREFMTRSAGSIVVGSGLRAEARQAPDDEAPLRSELLLDLTLDAQAPNVVGFEGGERVIVSVSGGSFHGPRLNGTIAPGGGDWIVQRPDGSRLLDVRIVMVTDDAQKIFVSWRGVAYTESGTLVARILPLFETSSDKYAWLNRVVLVGVYRPARGTIAYRVYRIL